MKNLLLLFTLSSVILSCSLYPQTQVNKHSENASSPYTISSDVKYPREKAEAQGLEYGISTQGIYSTQAAQNIINQGGNLIDAFIAASFVISVERPHSTGLGGGGFLLFHEAKTKKIYAVDFRERAPIKATREMYLDAQNQYIPTLSKDGPLAIAVPGLVKGLWEVHKKFGKLSWKNVIIPAIELAEQGFDIYASLDVALKNKKSTLTKNPTASKIFLNSNQEPLQLGQKLIQTDLANSLKLISEQGPSAFYKGQIAQKMITEIQKQGGILSKDDLKNYIVKWREPVHGQFLNYNVYSMPPPSSGGIHILQFLNILENEKWTIQDMNRASTIHMQAAALQSAFADRSVYLGDPDFVKIPQKKLLSKSYALQRRNEIPNLRARTGDEVSPGSMSLKEESLETTHISMMDSSGNAIASTQTINGWMGSSFVIPSTGILMNNKMDDFSAKPGAPNLFGALGGQANEIEARKTPLSSMSPTLVLDSKNEPILSLGAPGGTRIISCTAETIFNHLYYKLPLWESITQIRLHHQWKPDTLSIDPPGPPAHEIENLKKMGYKVEISSVPCRVMAVSRQEKFTAVADPRDIGTSLAK